MSSGTLFRDCPECDGVAEATTPLVPTVDAYHCPDCGHRWEGRQ